MEPLVRISDRGEFGVEKYHNLHPKAVSENFVNCLNPVNKGNKLVTSIARLVERNYLSRSALTVVSYDLEEQIVEESIKVLNFYQINHLQFLGDKTMRKMCGDEIYHISNSKVLRNTYRDNLIIVTYESRHIGALNDISTRIHPDLNQSANNNYLEKIPLVLLKNRVE